MKKLKSTIEPNFYHRIEWVIDDGCFESARTQMSRELFNYLDRELNTKLGNKVEMELLNKIHGSLEEWDIYDGKFNR